MAMRDPSPSAGVPCLYRCDADTGFLASHASIPRSLGLLDLCIDWDFIAHNLQHPHVKNGQTGFVGLRELLPGCAIEIPSGNGESRLVWQPWSYVEPGRRHRDRLHAIDDVRRAITTVVGAWARVDRSILLELSGGLDSSIVGVSLQGSGADLACCTLVPPVPSADERNYAGQIADSLGVELQTEPLPFESAIFDFEAAWQPAVPRIGLLQHAVNETMAKAGRRNGVRSHFSGGGGDSVLCYLQTVAPAVDAYLERGLGAAAATIRDLAHLHQTTLWNVALLTLRKLRRGPRAPYVADRSFVAAHVRSDDYPPHPWTGMPAGTLPGDRERIIELAGCQAFRDAVPRGGLPFRMPLLSQPVVEACLRTPTWMWVEGGMNRAVARSAFAGRLPPDILHRRSKGTYMSYLGVVYRDQKWKMRDYLLSGRLHAQGLLDALQLEQFIAQDLPPRDRSFTRIFELCMIENWARHHA
ncbi:asparagine synthase-related protein [Luteimonas sp. SDU101]|uniref:asparagine synthase-related protein n=1 Tax=Luteimonas sp. SDU101 TaxID=3422593 RepID=UPI003EB93F35